MKTKIIIGLLVSLGCLAWALKGIAWVDVGHAFAMAQPQWFLIALVVYATGYALRAVRWSLLLKSLKSIPPSRTIRPLILGFFCNNILPFRLGEIIRSYLLSRNESLPISAVFGSVVSERLTDMIGFLVVFLGAVLFFPFPPSMKHAASGMAAFLGVGLLFLWQIKQHPQILSNAVAKLPVSKDRQRLVIEKVRSFLEGTRSLDRAGTAARIIGLSLVIWMLEGTVLFLLCRAFPNPIPYGGSFFLLFFIGLSVALPQAPGYVGTIEFFGSMALVLLGVPKGDSLAMILAIHGFQFICIALAGIFAMIREGLSFKTMREVSQSASKP